MNAGRGFCLFLMLGLTLALMLSSGCVRTTVESYRAVPDSRADQAYVKPGVDFSRYRRLRAEPLEVYFYDGVNAPDSAELARIRQIFRDAFLEQLNGDYEVVNVKAPDVLNVRGSLVDLDRSDVPGDIPVQGRAASLIAAGQLTFFMELADSETGEILARAGDRDPAPPSIAGDARSSDWQRTRVAAERWAGMFRAFLDEQLGR